MASLIDKSNQILNEKNTNLKPEYLKAGITCLGVIGTYEGSSSTTEGIKQFATIEEMQADTTAQEGDLAVVYGSEVQNATVDSKFQVATFPDTVVLDSAITDYVEVRYRAVDSSKMFDCMGSLDSSRFSMDCYTDSGSIRVEYTSSDGITYTRTDTTGNPVDFGTEIYYERTEYWNDAIGKFIQIGGMAFKGLFTYEYDKTGEFDLVIDAMSNVSYNGSEFTYENGHISIPSALYKRLSSMYEEYCVRNNISASYTSFNVHFFQTDNDHIYVSFMDWKDFDGNALNLVNIGDGFRLCVTFAQNSTTTSSDTTRTYYKYNISNDSYETLIATIDTNVYYKVTHYDGYTSFFYSNVIVDGTLLSNTGVYVNTTSASISKNRNIRLLSIGDSHNVIQEKVLDSLNIEKLYLISHYSPAPTQLSAIADCVYSKEFYGKNGVETGTLQNKENLTKDGVRRRVDIWLDYSSGIVCPSDISEMFSNYTNLTTIPQLDTSNVTNMHRMFAACTNLTEIPLLDTSSVTDMGGMFSDCTNLTTIPLLNTSSATTMASMFMSCIKLTEIPLLDTGNVTNMYNMFAFCPNLTTIPLLDTSSVTNMEGMFNDCRNLSDESLNNILAMCVNATSYTGTKTLKYMILTSAQANKCKTLSNYSAFTAAGWTTGY